MTPPLPNEPVVMLTPEQRRGRALLLVIFIVSVLVDIAIIVIKAMQDGLDATDTSWVRVCLSIGLMYAVWIGQRWARWLFVALMYAASLLMLLVVISRPNPILFAMFLAFAATGSLIAFYRGVSSFLLFQRQKRG